jgi:hypothetical protein
MLRGANDLRRFAIRAADGEIGHVDQFFFDDQKWTVRYLVVDTGSWLPGRRVLISPIALGEVDWPARCVEVRLTRQQVENSPDIGTEKPVSRQHEIDYFQYYGWPFYWAGPGLWGSGMYPGYLAAPPPVPPPPPSAEPEEQEPGDPHLRATGEVAGYGVQTRDGEIGHVEDFILEMETWAIRYVVVDTRNWWPGKKVLLPPEWIESVSWPEAMIHVDLSRDVIKNAPEWDPSEPITREYESRLYGYYGRPGYWSSP